MTWKLICNRKWIEAQNFILDTFGIQVIDGTQIPGIDSDGAEGSKYYLINSLKYSHYRFVDFSIYFYQ